MLTESDLKEQNILLLWMWLLITSTMQPEQFNIYLRPVHNSHNLFANCSSRNWLNDQMNTALLSPRLYLVQTKYILRVVITQMRGSEGYEVNSTSISLTPGLDCLKFPQDNHNQSF